MIVFSRCGQLGNQIFQYLFIKSIAKKNEKIFLINMEEIFELFHNVDAINICGKSKIIKIIISKIEFYIQKLSQKGILGNVSQDTEEINGYIVKKGKYNFRDGIIGFIKYVEGSHYQSEEFVKNNALIDLCIKKKHMESAEDFLSNLPDGCKKIFIHMRLGDYDDYDIFGKKNMILPVQYYRYCIDCFLKTENNPYFIVISNQPEKAETIFSDIKDKKISLNSQFVDFILMTKCDGGILSCSSFSWLGGYFMKSITPGRSKIFAPEYWLGFKSNIWYPYELKTEMFDYVNIKNLI